MQIRVGITGGIGAGKSSVAKYISKQGFVILFADEIAKKFLATDIKIKQKIISTFGKESYHNDVPNKSFLAEKVFNNEENLKIINSIIHPPTLKKIDNLMGEKHSSEKLIFVESALIFEANFDDMFDYILYVTAEKDVRIRRILERGGITEAEIHNRINSQLPDENKKKNSDFVIHNNENFVQLEERCEFILSLLKSIAQLS